MKVIFPFWILFWIDSTGKHQFTQAVKFPLKNFKTLIDAPEISLELKPTTLFIADTLLQVSVNPHTDYCNSLPSFALISGSPLPKISYLSNYFWAKIH